MTHGLEINLKKKTSYKTNNYFSSATTTNEGNVAVGSEKGIIRFYPSPESERSLTNFYANPGNEEISSINVSPNGDWVVSTSPRSISVINILSSTKGKNAFSIRLGKEKQPVVYLTLTPKHQKLLAQYFGGQLPPFSSAKFDVKNGTIYSIIAGIGSALVCWDFKRIEQGGEPTYQIVFLEGEQVVDEVPFIPTDDIIYISDHNVSSIGRRRGRK